MLQTKTKLTAIFYNNEKNSNNNFYRNSSYENEVGKNGNGRKFSGRPMWISNQNQDPRSDPRSMYGEDESDEEYERRMGRRDNLRGESGSEGHVVRSRRSERTDKVESVRDERFDLGTYNFIHFFYSYKILL